MSQAETLRGLVELEKLGMGINDWRLGKTSVCIQGSAVGAYIHGDWFGVSVHLQTCKPNDIRQSLRVAVVFESQPPFYSTLKGCKKRLDKGDSMSYLCRRSLIHKSIYMKQYAVIHGTMGLQEGYSDTDCTFFLSPIEADKHIDQLLKDFRSDKTCIKIVQEDTYAEVFRAHLSGSPARFFRFAHWSCFR